MTVCEICGAEEEVTKCKRCGTPFCENCGSVMNKLCVDCLDELEG